MRVRGECGCGCGLSCGHTFFRTSDRFFSNTFRSQTYEEQLNKREILFSLNKSVLNRACSVLRSSHKSKSRRLLGLSVVMPVRQEEII